MFLTERFSVGWKKVIITWNGYFIHSFFLSMDDAILTQIYKFYLGDHFLRRAKVRISIEKEI